MKPQTSLETSAHELMVEAVASIADCAPRWKTENVRYRTEEKKSFTLVGFRPTRRTTVHVHIRITGLSKLDIETVISDIETYLKENAGRFLSASSGIEIALKTHYLTYPEEQVVTADRTDYSAEQ